MLLFVCLLTRLNHFRLNITNSTEELGKVIENITTDSGVIAEWGRIANICVSSARSVQMSDRKPILIYRCLMARIFDFCSAKDVQLRGNQLASALPAKPPMSVRASPRQWPSISAQASPLQWFTKTFNIIRGFYEASSSTRDRRGRGIF